jgi:hypothetical protein
MMQEIPNSTELLEAFTCFVSVFGTSDLLCRSPIIDPHRKSMGRHHCVVGGCTGYRPGASIVVISLRVPRYRHSLLGFVSYTGLSSWAACTEVLLFMFCDKLHGSETFSRSDGH